MPDANKTGIYTISMATALVAVLFLPQFSHAVDSFSTWAKSYGGTGNENLFRSVVRASDGGYVIAGETNSFGAGSKDVWVIKLDEDGIIDWQKTYGGGGSEVTRSIQQTSDGGYVVAARTNSFAAAGTDFWVLKLDSSGTVQWEKTFGGTGSEMPHYVQQTSDGGYLVGGFTKSFGAQGKDYFAVKLDSTGQVDWQKRYGGAGDDVIRFVMEVSDGGYLAAGFTHSFGVGGDILILRLDEDGDVIWQKTYGGSKFEEVSTILEVADGYIVMEQSSSFTGSTDAWIFKLDFDGDIFWQKTFGGRGGMDELSAAELTADGGFIAAGETSSNYIPSEDFWVVKFDSAGNPVWQKRYGGTEIDSAESMALTPEGGAIAVGTTRSFGAGAQDIWTIRVDSSGSFLGGCSDDVETHSTTGTTKITKAVPVDRDVDMAATNASPKDTDATVMESSARIETQCDVTPISP